MEPALSSPKLKRNRNMSFDEVAKNIIKNSIRSAICIDDKYASAYSTTDEIADQKLKFDEPKKLYNSFREFGQCDLDIYQFESLDKSWKKDYMIPNKDLMILDWELDQNTVPKYKDSIGILSDVVVSNQIPFVVIYTNASDLNNISKILISEFNSVEKAFDYESLFVELNGDFEKMPHGENDIDFESFFDDENNQKLFFDYIYNFERRSEIKDEILNKVIETMELKVNSRGVCSKIARVLKDKTSENKDYIKALSLIGLNQEKSLDLVFTIERVESKDHILKVNNTTVLIYHKSDNGDGVKPEELFDVFSKAIISNPHNYLSLLSLELKDQLRKEFSKIGTRFSDIDEIAFFYHMQNYKDIDVKTFNKRRIYDFVIKSWLQDLSAQTINGKSDVVNLIEDGIAKVGEIPTELDKNLQEALIKYSAFISTSSCESVDKKLKFGDIFKNIESEDYFLCITPHCDCVNPKDKIKNNFYFIKGRVLTNNEELNKAIEEAEQEYYSFLNIENKAVCIDWSCKPFTVYIADNNIEQLKFRYLDAELSVKHITNLKENFAQRLSNESFGYGYRVGIDLPHVVS